jgi:Domain of unknown function (DUF4249)
MLKQISHRPASLLCLLLLCAVACIDSYNPPQVSETGDLLVIDGNVNTTDKTATVRISHPMVLNSEDKSTPETGATVVIIAGNGKNFTLPETSAGIYSLTGIDLPTGMDCRLVVNTKSGGQFESSQIVLKQTPKIDKLYFNYLDDGVEVLVDTHDPEGDTRHYQWNFEETWEYSSAFESNYKLEGRTVVPRQPADRIYRCWKTVASPKITITSTKQLKEDVVNKRQLVFIPVASQKTSIKYSILVKQRAISEDEFVYLTQLQKTTESLGGLFDPQPSQVYGNIKRVSEKGGTAIGNFTGGSYEQQRIFLGFYDLPSHLLVPQPKGTCQLDTVCLVSPRFTSRKCSIDLENMPPTELIVAELYEGISIFGYHKTTDECADCRTQGGSLNRPPFW